MKINLSYFIIVLVLFFQLGCNKNSYTYNPSPKNVKIDSTIWNASNFKTGSYWILKDVNTGDEDSLVMFWNSPKYMNNVYEYVGEFYNAYLIQYHNNDTLFYWQYRVRSVDESSYKIVSYNSLVLQQHALDDDQIPFTPIVSNNIVDTVNHYVNLNRLNVFYQTQTKTELLNSYVQDGVTYNNVYHSNIFSGSSYGDEIFFNQSHGFLKMVLYNPYQHRTFLVQRCHIERN